MKRNGAPSFVCLTFGLLVLSGCTSERPPSTGPTVPFSEVAYLVADATGSETTWAEFRIGVKPSFQIYDETGAWTAMTALSGRWSAGDGGNNEHYLLLDPETGCLRAQGNEGSLLVDRPDGGTQELRSRYTDYLLGRPDRIHDRLSAPEGRILLLIHLGFILGESDDPAAAIDDVWFGNGTVTGERPTIEVKFEGSSYPGWLDRWTIEYGYERQSYPSRISWLHEPLNHDLDLSEAPKGQMVMAHAETADSSFPTCRSQLSFEEPRGVPGGLR